MSAVANAAFKMIHFALAIFLYVYIPPALVFYTKPSAENVSIAKMKHKMLFVQSGKQNRRAVRLNAKYLFPRN